MNFILGKNYFSVGWIQYIIFGLLLVGIVGSFMAVFKKSKLHAFFMFLLIGFMPLGVFVIDVISLTAQANAMQIYQMTIVLILPTVLLDKVFLLKSNKKILKYFSAVVIIATLLLSANYFIYDNAYYTRSAAYSEQTTLLINRVWSRIESMTEYNQNKNIPILILMDMQPLYEKAVPIYEDYIEFDMGYYDRFIGFNQLDSIIGTGKFAGQMHNKLGIDIITANREQMAQIYENPEYLTIGTWPEESSIKIIDGVLVVNLATVIYSEIDESEDVIRVTAKSPSENIEYAFYLYVDGHHEYTQWYGKEGVFEIPKEYLVNAKNYQVEIFCVDEKGKSLGKRYTPVIKAD